MLASGGERRYRYITPSFIKQFAIQQKVATIGVHHRLCFSDMTCTRWWFFEETLVIAHFASKSGVGKHFDHNGLTFKFECFGDPPEEKKIYIMG